MEYILGVDGGNTKTDYYLFDIDGNFIDMYRGGTCSHEGLKDSFDGSYRVMKAVFDEFLGKHNLKPEDIKASVFGLAGDDLPYQHEKLCEKVKYNKEHKQEPLSNERVEEICIDAIAQGSVLLKNKNNIRL